jgi:hypothetical protein
MQVPHPCLVPLSLYARKDMGPHMGSIETIKYRLTAAQSCRFASLFERSAETLPYAHIRSWAEVMPQDTMLAHDS